MLQSVYNFIPTLVALAEPPTVGGSSKGQWLTSEILSMFLFHEMRALSQSEEFNVINNLIGETGVTFNQIMKLTHKLRSSEDASLSNISNSLTTSEYYLGFNVIVHTLKLVSYVQDKVFISIEI